MMPVNPGDTIVQISSGEEGGGTLYSPGPKQQVAVPSVNELVTISPETTTIINPSTPTKVKEVTITKDGAYRFIFFLWMSDGAASDQGLAQVYRNGSPAGAVHNTRGDASAADTVFNLIPALQSEDIGGWAVGDLAQLYIWCATTARNVRASNFGLWAELALLTPQIEAGVVNLNGV